MNAPTKLSHFSYFAFILIFMSQIAYSIDWEVGQYAAVPRSNGSLSNAKIVSIAPGAIRVEWIENGGALEKVFTSAESLKAPILIKRKETSSSQFPRGRELYRLKVGDSELFVDRLGRANIENKRVIPLEAMPEAPWRVGQYVAIPRSDGGSSNAKIVEIKNGMVKVSWKSKGVAWDKELEFMRDRDLSY